MGQTTSSSQDQFPYKPIREVQSSPRVNNDFHWTLWDGVDVKDSRKQVSIFCFEPSTNVIAQSAFKRFKTLRHPNMLQFLHGTTIEEQKKMYIVTDKVEPLFTRIEHLLSLPDSIPWGIHQVCKAVHFLNKDCNLVHGNINLSTVYVNQVGDWKLGGFEMISPVEEVQSGKSLLFSYPGLSSNIQPSPELLASLDKCISSLSESPSHAVDSWLMGCFIWTIYNHSSLIPGSSFDRNRLKDMSKLPPSIKDDYIKLLTGSPRNRLALDRFLESPFFDNIFVQTCLFLENLTIKDSLEKEKFFKSLPKIIPQFPESMAKYKILPTLTRALDFGSADHHALPIILPLASKLSPDEYKSQITPSILKWFAAPDRTLRICLLSNIDTIIVHLDQNQVSNQIWTPLAQGFTDGSPQLRELTVKSLLHFAPKLGEKIVNGDMLKYLAQLQVDPVPGIRCNTTVCLGKIAHLLTPAIRQKVLLPAFSRSIKDPFAPSRKAGLSALLHCHAAGYFAPNDVASKLIPAVSPLTLDSELIVRQTAISSLQMFIKYLEEQSNNMPETAATAPDQKTAAQISANEGGGMFEWAIGKMLGSEPTKTNPTNTNQQQPASPNMNSISSPNSISSANSISSPNSMSSANSISSNQQRTAPKSNPVSTHDNNTSFDNKNQPKNQPKNTNDIHDVPWEDDEEEQSLKQAGTTARTTIPRPTRLPTQKTAPVNQQTSSTSLGTWNDGNDWKNQQNDLKSDWEEDNDFTMPNTTSTSKVSKPTTSMQSSSSAQRSSKGMSLGQPQSTNSWEDEESGGDWGDFAEPKTTITRLPKSANVSRFG